MDLRGLVSMAWEEWKHLLIRRRVVDEGANKIAVFVSYIDSEFDCFDESGTVAYQARMKSIIEEARVVMVSSSIAKIADKFTRMKNGTICKYLYNEFCVLCSNIF